MKIRIAFFALSMSLTVSAILSNIQHAKISLQVGVLLAMGILLFEFNTLDKK